MPGNQNTRLINFMDEESAFETLVNASNTFVKREDGAPQIWAASRDWFLEEWERDTFSSLPRISLSRSDLAELERS